jgi:alpha-L-fucosidase 2
MMTSRLLTIIATALAISAATVIAESPTHGVWSRIPGKRWEDSFVTGNGRMGAMLFSGPESETFVANHCRLFLPLGTREIVPDLAAALPELRSIIRNQHYGAAMKFLVGRASEQGFPGLTWTDKFHPGVTLRINQPPVGAVRDYARTEDFATGEITERWRDDRGEFRRRAFVSRTDNVIALSISGPVPCALEFPAVEHELIESQQTTTTEWVTCHNIYRKGKGGFDTAVRIARSNEGCDTLVLIRIVPWKTPVKKDQSNAWATSPEHPDSRRRVSSIRLRRSRTAPSWRIAARRNRAHCCHS